MLIDAPPCAPVIRELANLLDGYDLVAHNASFDLRFLKAEFERVRRRFRGGVACSLLSARRLYPEAPDHKLETLTRHLRLSLRGRAHRALADAEVTAQLWIRMLKDLRRRYGIKAPPFSLFQEINAQPKSKTDELLRAYALQR